MNANASTTIVQKNSLYSLRRCQKSSFGRQRAYELLCDGIEGERFFFSITENGEQEIEEIGCTFAEAATLFEHIVRGDVPAYVLREILEDFVREME